MATGEELTCKTSSIITKNVTIAYSVTYGVTLLVVSFYSFRFLNTYNVKFTRSSFIKKMLKWCKDVWNRRRCYIPIITHLFDQITDICVTIQFYQLAIAKSEDDWIACGGLNMWYLFILTILSMAIYRIISSYLIYKSTGYSLSHLIFQILDVELFRALYINYLCNKTEPCDPQRWITAMEASLESSPQAIIQMIYLVKTNTFTSSHLVLISLLSSLWSIVSKLVSDDKIIVKEKAKRAQFTLSPFIVIDIVLLLTIFTISCITFVIIVAVSPFIGCYALWNYLNDKYWDNKYVCCPNNNENIEKHMKLKEIQEKGTVTKEEYKLEVPALKQPTMHNVLAVDDDISGSRVKRSLSQEIRREQDKNSMNLGCCKLNLRNHYKWMQWWYALRVVWRLLDVSSRIFICTLCWVIIGGTALSIIICVEFIFVLFVSYKLTQWEFIFGVVALVISTTNGTARNISAAIFTYRTITNYILMILITIFMTVEFECWRCPTYEDRDEYLSETTIFVLFIYCWCAAFITPYITYSFWRYEVFEDQASTSRDIKKMYASQNYNGIIEIQLYAGKYGYFDDINKRSLLSLALRQKLVPIVSFLSSKAKMSPVPLKEMDADGKNILDHYCSVAVANDGYNTKDYRTMTSFLLDVYKTDRNFTDSMGRNAFLCGCYNKESDIVSEFTQYDRDIVFSEDKRGRTMFHYLWSFESFMQKFDAIEFYKTYPEFIQIDGESPFFYAAHKKKAQLVQKLLELNLDFVNRKDHRSKNILDYYVSNSSLLNTTDLVSIYKYNNNLVGTDGRNVFLCAVLAKDMQTVHHFMEVIPDIVHSTDTKKKNMFDFLWRHSKYMKEIDPFVFYEKHSDFISKQNCKSPFFYACYSGNTEVTHELMVQFADLINTTDDNSYTVLDYFCSNPALLSNVSLLQIFKHSPNLQTAKQKLTVFLCCCYTGNIACVNEIIKLNKDVLKETNVDGYNGSSIAKMNKKDAMVHHLADVYQIDGKIPDQLVVDTRTTKIIILGTGRSGKTALFHQFIVSFNYETFNEIQDSTAKQYAEIVFRNLLYTMKSIIEQVLYDSMAAQTQLKWDSDEASNCADLFRQIEEANKLTPELVDALKVLWNEGNIQRMYELKPSLFDDNIEYFMKELDRIKDFNYVPNMQDILWGYSRTSGIVEQRFEREKKRYSVIDVGGARSERRKWLNLDWDEMSVALYVIDISAYDLHGIYDYDTNRMTESLVLFEKICKESLQKCEMVLFFNKIDRFKKKFKKYPITNCAEFKEFDGNIDEYEETVDYIQNVFKSKDKDNDREIYMHCTCAVDIDFMTNVFADFFPYVVQASMAGLV